MRTSTLRPFYHGQDAAKKAATEKESFSGMEVGCDWQRSLMFVVLCCAVFVLETIISPRVGRTREPVGR